MAATRPSPPRSVTTPPAARPPVVPPSAAARRATVAGPVRPGRRTKLLVKHLVPRRHRADRPPRHRPRLGRGADRRGRRARCSTAGRPRAAPTRTSGRSCSSKRASCSSTCPTTRCSSSLSDGDPLVVRPPSGRRRRERTAAGEVLRRGELLGARRGARPASACAPKPRRAAARSARRSSASRTTRSSTCARSASCWPGGSQLPRFADRLPRPLDAAWSCAASATSATCARCARSSATCGP